jgi:drug/metabolite transporter (DMT)-like permease
MDNIKRKKGIQAALTSAIFLGLAPIFGKEAILFGFSPIAVTAFRTTLAALLLLAITYFFQRKYFYIYPVGLVGCLLAGAVNGIGSIFYYTALSRMDAGVGHLLYSFYPLFIALWLIADRQPITSLTKLRLALSIPAIFLIIQTGGKSLDLTGAVLMIASSILYALHLMINQRVLYEVPAPTVTLYTLISMSVTVMVAYACFDRYVPQPHLPWWPVFALAFMTFLSRILLFLGVKHLGGMQTSLLGLSELLVALVVSQVWLGERLAATQWLGAFLLALSLFLIGFDRFSPEKRNATGWLAWLNSPQSRFPSSLKMDIRSPVTHGSD